MQNLHLVYGLSSFLRILFALDTVSALALTIIVMRDLSRNLEVRFSIVKRSFFLALYNRLNSVILYQVESGGDA